MILKKHVTITHSPIKCQATCL